MLNLYGTVAKNVNSKTGPPRFLFWLSPYLRPQNVLTMKSTSQTKSGLATGDITPPTARPNLAGSW